MCETFGEFVKKKRIEAGLSASDLANQLDISASYQCSMESGTRHAPGYKLLKRMETALKLGESDKGRFYDLAALSAKTPGAPADMVGYINENPKIRSIIRAASEGRLSEEEIDSLWEKLRCESKL